MTLTLKPKSKPKPRRKRESKPRRGKGTAALSILTTAIAAIGILLTAPHPATAATTSQVRLSQIDLNGLAYNAGKTDGVVGPRTRAAVESFQSDRCLAVDGVIGPRTLGGLKSVVERVQNKAGTTVSGTYGSGTITAVKRYQHAHHLTADGIAGPSTMKSMGITRLVPSCHSAGAQRARIVRIAKSQIGVTESSGKCVPGKPYNVCGDWCAAFATWVWRDAGVRIPYFTYVPSVYSWAVAHGKWVGTSQLSTARPGDLIIFGSAHNRYHIGVVDHVSGRYVRVVSGNTSDPNGSHRIGVYDKTYLLSGSVFYGLVRP